VPLSEMTSRMASERTFLLRGDRCSPTGLAGGHSLSTSTPWRRTYGITNVVSELARNQLPDLEWREPRELCDDLN
jgi:hypothetical protein